MHSPLRYGNKVYPKLGFIGAGNMAKAIIVGLIKTGYPAAEICVSSPSEIRRAALSHEYGVSHHHDNIQNALDADVIILAVKPQMMQAVCELLRQHVNLSNKLLVTLAAGIEVAQYQVWLGDEIEIIRVMPNTPAIIGEGVSGIYASDKASGQAKMFVEKLMQSVGLVHTLKQEEQMHAFIATAGSAPAYFFKFMQAMQEAAIKLGCSDEEAKLLVLQSAKGAVLLAEAAESNTFEALAQQVTSKGGTTEQALNAFVKGDLFSLVYDAMKAASDKSRTMSAGKR
ncbi:pyrroline-5-carboxylate reductase [Thorsellia anophelis]|uniref:Pyrroline-5-carboxylate reductase n=1 Tax=Thorsellia anophelis DSM 18579 TaxID=1123402 RepID=A0A1H9YD16_9GAMM|nr:pyrroline-5-carboxylate reductase [Thorsellia anophelis]SES66856.1 pyrroline-5-carboxylate reductase [Thorsellia anophelis DSM 18579]